MKSYSFDPLAYTEQLIPLLKELQNHTDLNPKKWAQVLNKFPKDGVGVFAKDEVIQGYRKFAGTQGLPEFDPVFVRRIQMKPTRTISGVTPVTILTKPFPCPGKCIFCPNDIRMPKSYLADEPGAQRAERNLFDPYLQTYNRLLAFKNTGHGTDKVELIILGGTWSYYPEAYQIWFIKEAFRALNDFAEGLDDRERISAQYKAMQERLIKFSSESMTVENSEIDGLELDKSYNLTVSQLYVAPERKAGLDEYQKAEWSELEFEQKRNEVGLFRNVGLVIETRPDNISVAEVMRIRRLGCTKAQIGFQSLNDEVLSLNKRGHGVDASRRAVALLRQAGFKIHAHWMPNLYGSSVEKDKADYDLLFGDPDFKPDELKIYPCSLIGSAELMQYYERGEWSPYSQSELLDILTYCLRNTPPYCRLTRVIRDIPSTDIVTGNTKTNFREVAERELERVGEQSQDIRAREVRGAKISADQLQIEQIPYETQVSKEIFIQGVTKEAPKKLAGFLRLSLPTVENPITELKDCAIVREVHVYGQVVGFGEKGEKEKGRAQHLGLGTLLLEEAKKIAKEAGFNKLAVISAIGTREYYRKRGFADGQLYQIAAL